MQNAVFVANSNHTAETITARLEDAGRTLMALRVSGLRPAGYRSNMPHYVREPDEIAAAMPGMLRPALPDARAIRRMDEALAWITLIPAERVTLRRIVGARIFVKANGRHVYSWRKLGALLGADHEAVRLWHGKAIGMIVAALHAAESRPAAA